MTTMTLEAPETTALKIDARNAMNVLRHGAQAGPEARGRALEALGRKAGLEAARERLRCYGAEWLAGDGGWKARDVEDASAHVERNIGRRLEMNESARFENAMLDVIEDLV